MLALLSAHLDGQGVLYLTLCVCESLCLSVSVSRCEFKNNIFFLVEIHVFSLHLCQGVNTLPLYQLSCIENFGLYCDRELPPMYSTLAGCELPYLYKSLFFQDTH